jgi:hypothetical protein
VEALAYLAVGVGADGFLRGLEQPVAGFGEFAADHDDFGVDDVAGRGEYGSEAETCGGEHLPDVAVAGMQPTEYLVDPLVPRNGRTPVSRVARAGVQIAVGV